MDPHDHHPGRLPSPGHPLQHYELHDRPFNEHLDMPMGPGPGPGTPSDRLRPQPTVRQSTDGMSPLGAS